MYGHWYAEFFYSGNRASHEGQIARGERTNRGRDSEKVRVKNGKASREVDNEIFRGYAIPKIKDGNYIIESGNVMMVTNGDRHDPSLEMVIVLDDEYETFMATAKEVIHNEGFLVPIRALALQEEPLRSPFYFWTDTLQLRQFHYVLNETAKYDKVNSKIKKLYA